nr:DUF3800 domain-containing protein [uncultured Anaerosporobacter sp.]
MKIYFDESGNTGCVINKENKLTFATQPIFVIGAVLIHGNNDEKKLIKKYQRFKQQFGFEGEIKGSDLLTRRNNEALNYFINEILDSSHFIVNLYDKQFYLVTLMMKSLMGYAFAEQEPVLFYDQASALCLQDNEFFIKYCEYIASPSEEHLKEYLQFLADYNYVYMNPNQNAVKEMAKIMLEKGELQLFVDDFMTYGWYDNPELTNVINLNAVSELIYSIKTKSKVDNNSIEFVHDHIFQFEETIATELNPFDINISFADSKAQELLQLADNVASISYHAMVRMVNHFSKKEEWKQESEWDMTLVSSILRKLGQENIKFTMPIHDWSAALCVKEMFAPGYPKARRKNIFFNEMYRKAQYEIAYSINYFNCEDGEIDKTMKR